MTDWMASVTEVWVTIKEHNDYYWVNLSKLSLLPGLFILAYKLNRVWTGKELTRTKTNTLVDWAFRIIFGYSFIYYILDSLSVIFLQRIFKVCYQAFFLHHLCSLYILVFTFSFAKPFFCFEVAPAVMHSAVLMFPQISWVQYLYVGSIVWLSLSYFMQPYNSFIQSQKSRKLVFPGIFSFILMKHFNCLGMLDAVNADRS